MNIRPNCHLDHISPIWRVLGWVLSLMLVLSVWAWNIPSGNAEEDLPLYSDSLHSSATSAPAESPKETADITVPSPDPEPSPESEPPEETAGLFDEFNSSKTNQITVADGFPCVEGEAIIQFRTSLTDYGVKQALSATDTVSSDIIQKNLHVVQIPEGQTIEQYIGEIKEQPGVVYAQPNYVYYLDDDERILIPDGAGEVGRGLETITNDSYLGYQWYLDKINAYEAWDATMGDAGVHVAVIDTGADLTHPDLAGRILFQTDVVDTETDAEDDNGHGTHVAGIIAATANNNEGIAGVASNTSLIVVDVFDTNGSKWWATTQAIVEGISYARSNGADVINLSLGSYTNDFAEENAVNVAVNAGVVVISSAGNDNTANMHYPSDLDSVISVIATDWDDNKASYSNYGQQKDISAPGGDSEQPPQSYIISTYPASLVGTGYQPYAWMAGTSMASPVVSGVVALMLSAHPGLTVEEVKERLYDSATDLGTAGRDNNYGYGRVDAYKAVCGVYVRFDSGGGSAVDAQLIEPGEKAAAPLRIPLKDGNPHGYIFGGWYKEPAGINAWRFASDAVTEETTLYAKWEDWVSQKDVVSGGKLKRTYYLNNGWPSQIREYFGADDTTGIYRIHYYTDGLRTSYRVFYENGNLKNIIELHSNGSASKANYFNTNGVRTSYKLYDTAGRMTHYVECYSNGSASKVNYYNVSNGLRTSFKLYDTSGRMTHYAECYSDGVSAKKLNYYNVSTGVRTSFKQYDTAGCMTHYAECYSDGVRARKINYYNPATGIRTSYKTYRTDGSTICWVQCDSGGKPQTATYYDENGNTVKIVRY